MEHANAILAAGAAMASAILALVLKSPATKNHRLTEKARAK